MDDAHKMGIYICCFVRFGRVLGVDVGKRFGRTETEQNMDNYWKIFEKKQVIADGKTKRVRVGNGLHLVSVLSKYGSADCMVHGAGD